MSVVLILVAAALAADGPDLANIDVAVAKCDARTMTRTFSDEPQRRRAFTIAAFNEQQAIIVARQALATRRLAMLPPGATIQPTPDERSAVERETQALTERQKELDDSRMLSGLRDDALDMMRRQYLVSCASGRDRGQD